MTTGNNVHTTGQITALENKANAFTNTTRMIAHRRLQTNRLNNSMLKANDRAENDSGSLKCHETNFSHNCVTVTGVVYGRR